MAVTDADRMRALMRVHQMTLTLEPVFDRAMHRVIAETMKANGLGPIRGLTAAAGVPEPTPDRLAVLLSGWQREVTRTIRPAMLAAFRRAAAFTLGRLPGQLPAVFGPNVRDVRAAAWLGSVENRLVGVGETAYQEAVEALRVSLETGEGAAKAADRVRESLGVTLRRASTIARTEAAAVVNGADDSISLELAEAGIEHAKEWLATVPTDGRTRHTHLEANGQSVRAGEKFDVGNAKLAYPGDPTGPAEEVINCRCTTILDVDEGDVPEEFSGTIVAARGSLAVFAPRDGDGDGLINDGKPDEAPAPVPTPDIGGGGSSSGGGGSASGPSNKALDQIGLPKTNPQLIDNMTKRGIDPGEWTRSGTNPNFNRGGEFENNCTRVVHAYEIRRRGYNVTATGYDPTTGDATDFLTWFDGGIDRATEGGRYLVDPYLKDQLEQQLPDFAAQCITDPTDYLNETVNSWPEGSRGIVWFQRPNQQTGHVFNVERTADGVKIIEAQEPVTGKDIGFDRYAGQVKQTGLSGSSIDLQGFDFLVFRVDDLEYNDGVKAGLEWVSN